MYGTVLCCAVLRPGRMLYYTELHRAIVLLHGIISLSAQLYCTDYTALHRNVLCTIVYSTVLHSVYSVPTFLQLFMSRVGQDDSNTLSPQPTHTLYRILTD